MSVHADRVVLVRILAVASFLVMFQGYLVAPLIPALSKYFAVSTSITGLMVPAYTIPYGLATLFYGPLSDRYGRIPIILTLLALMTFATLLTAFSTTAFMFLAIRVFMGVATGGIVPISVAAMGDHFPYEERGKPIGLLFGAMSGGMAFGSTLGAYMNPYIGWRNEFIITGFLCAIIFFIALINRKKFDSSRSAHAISIKSIFRNCALLLGDKLGSKVYLYIFLNGMFHSGVFAWLGYYFTDRYQLSDQGIGIALLGYGVPGMLLGVSIGKLADKYGRRHLIPIGLFIGAITVLILAFHFPLMVAGFAVAFLSLGYDMSQPLFAGMASFLGKERLRGQAMGLAACLLFLGYGIGALVFQLLLSGGLTVALISFASLELTLGAAALRIFKQAK